MKMYTEEQQIDRDEYVKCLIYGQSGSGKTTLSCTFPNTILIDFEKGKGKNRPALQVVIDEYSELEKLINALTTDPKFYNNYETVVFDSINEMVEIVIRDVVLGYASKRQYDDQLTQGDYGKIGRELLRIVRYSIDQLSDKYNLIWTCAESPISYQDEQRQPSIVGKMLPATLPRLMDIVGCTYTLKDQHALTIASSSFAYAKNRYGISGNRGVIVPHYNQLEKLITGE